MGRTWGVREGRTRAEDAAAMLTIKSNYSGEMPIAGSLWEDGGVWASPPTRIHAPALACVTGRSAELQSRDGVQDPSFCLPV